MSGAYASSLIAGLAAGALIGVLTRAIETSGIALGPFALFGNGALAVPAVLGPVAIFAGWSRLRVAPAFPGRAVAFTAASLVGLGLGYGLATGQPPSLLGGAFGFGIFIVPTALLAGLTIAALKAWRIGAAVVAAAFVAGAVLALVPPFSSFGGLGATGISTGAAVIGAERRSAATVVLIGAALALVVILTEFAPGLFFR